MRQAKARALAEEERELSQLRTRLAAKERQWHESAVEHASTAATAQVQLMILFHSMHSLLNEARLQLLSGLHAAPPVGPQLQSCSALSFCSDTLICYNASILPVRHSNSVSGMGRPTLSK